MDFLGNDTAPGANGPVPIVNHSRLQWRQQKQQQSRSPAVHTGRASRTSHDRRRRCTARGRGSLVSISSSSRGRRVRRQTAAALTGWAQALCGRRVPLAPERLHVDRGGGRIIGQLPLHGGHRGLQIGHAAFHRPVHVPHVHRDRQA